MNLAGEDEEFIRDYAMSLINAYVPSDTGDPGFQEITLDYGNVGTTCGYLVHWLMWSLGCRDPKLVNRTDPAGGLKYVPGMNISRIANSKFFRHYSSGNHPERGDLVFLSNGPPNTEHVNVSMGVEGDIWHGADAGQRNNDGKQCARFIDRTRVGNTVTYLGNSKGIVGWISLMSLPLTVPPKEI